MQVANVYFVNLQKVFGFKSIVDDRGIKMYRVGLPFWKLAARLGVPLLIRIQVMHDHEANVYIATSTDLAGLIAEAPNLEELMLSVHDCADMLIEHALHQPLKRSAKAAWDGTIIHA